MRWDDEEDERDEWMKPVKEQLEIWLLGIRFAEPKRNWKLTRVIHNSRWAFEIRESTYDTIFGIANTGYRIKVMIYGKTLSICPLNVPGVESLKTERRERIKFKQNGFDSWYDLDVFIKEENDDEIVKVLAMFEPYFVQPVKI